MPSAPPGSAAPAELAELAASVATATGPLLLDGRGRAFDGALEVGTKSTLTDMVTEVDRAAEQFIVGALLATRPGDGILGEEGTTTDGGTGVRWIIDPLDGTTNFLYGIPAFAVSIAAEVDGTVAAAAVFDPVHDELFTASRGGGGFLRPPGLPPLQLRVGGPPTLATALVGTGFSYSPERRTEQAAVLTGVLASVRDIRRAGSAALDLCAVACGRLDAFYEYGLAPWDFAGGSLIASEAGADVGTLFGDPPTTDVILAAPPHLAGPLRQLLVRATAGAASTSRA